MGGCLSVCSKSYRTICYRFSSKAIDIEHRDDDGSKIACTLSKTVSPYK